MRTHIDPVADILGQQFPKVRAMLLDAKEDLTAFADFPPDIDEGPVDQLAGVDQPGDQARHRCRPGLPQPARSGRLEIAGLFEMHDAWIAFPGHYLPGGSMDKLYAELPDSTSVPPNTTNRRTS